MTDLSGFVPVGTRLPAPVRVVGTVSTTGNGQTVPNTAQLAMQDDVASLLALVELTKAVIQRLDAIHLTLAHLAGIYIDPQQVD